MSNVARQKTLHSYLDNLVQSAQKCYEAELENEIGGEKSGNLNLVLLSFNHISVYTVIAKLFTKKNSN